MISSYKTKNHNVTLFKLSYDKGSVLALFMLMGILQKPTQRSHYSETCQCLFFPVKISLERLQLIVISLIIPHYIKIKVLQKLSNVHHSPTLK
jgi:hypothetical protein